jgi:hypothetical protein
MVLAFFRQVLCIPDPATGFTITGRFVVAQLAVQALDELDAFAKINAKRFGGFFLNVPEILQAVFPATAIGRIAVIAAITGRFKQVLVLEIAAFDELADKDFGESERFYNLMSHLFLLFSIRQ